MKYIIASLLALLIACAPGVVTPDGDGYLNSNPDLTLGECDIVTFHTDKWGWEFIEQCVPDDYTLYEQVGNYPMRVNHTGAGYTFLPNGAYGDIGFTLPPTQLLPGCYAIKSYGEGQMWGDTQEYNLMAHWSMAGVKGVVNTNSHNFNAPGDYIATLYLDAPQLAEYTISVYLSLQYGSATANSYIMITDITIEEVSAAHCN